MSPRSANLLTVSGLLALLVMVALTAPRWARLFRQPLPTALEDEAAPSSPGAPKAVPSPEAAPLAEAQRRINVKLFFEAVDRPGLVQEERSVAFSSDLARQLRWVVEELIRGSQAGFESPISPDTRVLELFVTARGVAYVDLSKEFSRGHPGGSSAELLMVYSVVNSITVNFPAVRRVQIVVEDRPAETVAGHVDISRPLAGDMTFLAASAVTPAAPAPQGGAPSPAPSPAS